MRLSNEMKNQRAERWALKLFLKQFLDEVSGVDLSYFGRNFTWDNKHEGFARIREWLDRWVASKDWTINYPSATIHHLAIEATILSCS